MSFYQRALDYIESVSSGREVACEYVKQAINRHIQDMENQGPKAGFWFDEKSARVYCEAVKLFRHTGGEFAGERFGLQPFQAFAIMSIFGWKRYIKGKKSRYRRFTRIYWETAKKSGKSEIAALIALLCALFDGEQGAQLYSAATTRDQARHVFRAAQIMTKYLRNDSGRLRQMINTSKYKIYIEETETFMEALSAEYSTLDGINPHVGIIDEYHAHDNSFVSDTIHNAMVARLQALLLTITTAGFNLQGPCYRIARNEAINILNGAVANESVFAYIFTIDEDDDWEDKKVWIKANPNIGRTVKHESMIDLYNKAKAGGPSKEVDFQTKNLNIWVHSKYNWIPDKTFMAAKSDFTVSDMIERGVPCWGGMDLGQTRDLTCIALLFDPEKNGGRYFFKLYTWCCQDAADKANEKGLPYMDWQRSQELKITPGNVTDYGYARKEMNELRSSGLQIVNIGYDISNSTQIVTDLTSDGFAMEQFSQAIRNMNPPTRTLEELFFSGVAAHDGNDLMRFMVQNVEIVRDSTGNIKVSKKDPDRKVDGVVAMVMALGQYMEEQRMTGGLYSEGVRTM